MTKIYVLNNKLVFVVNGNPEVFPYRFEFDNDTFTIIPLYFGPGQGFDNLIFKAHQITDENGKFHPVEKIYALISQFAGAEVGTDSNFANTDLTLTDHRTHNLGAFGMSFVGGLAFNVSSSETSIGGSALLQLQSGVDIKAEAQGAIELKKYIGSDVEGFVNISQDGAVSIGSKNEDLTLSGKNGASYINMAESNGEIRIQASSDLSLNSTGSSDVRLNSTRNIQLTHNAGKLVLNSIPIFADEVMAGAGGLTLGCVYRTGTGELRIKL